MRRRIASFLALPGAEQAVLLQALLRLPFNAVVLKLRGLGRLARVPAATATPPVAPARIAELVAIAARHGLARGNCLSRSVTLHQLLLRAGVAAQLRIGARRAAEGLEAHAWIEHDGRPLNDSPDVAVRYPPFAARPDALPRLV